MSSRRSYTLAVIVLLLAAGFRIWQLTTLPVGLNNQEMANVDLMRDSIQQGNIRVFYDVEGQGQEGFYHSVLALSSLLFGTGTFGFRILSVFASILTIALIYTLGTRLSGHIGGLFAAALMSVTMWDILLARLVVVETLLPLIVTSVLLALARALPVYPHHRTDNTRTVDFAILGALVGLALYVHPSGLMLVLAVMVFITYIVLTVRPLSIRQISYIGFAIVMVVIVAMPYVISTIRAPEYNAGRRIFGDYGSITISMLETTAALLLKGDSNILHNLPSRPMFDIITGMIVLLGVMMSIINWRQPRYALLLTAAIFLAPSAVLADSSPNFMAMSIVLPVLVLYFGVGLSCLIEQFGQRGYRFGLLFAFGLLLFNGFWTWDSLFQRWQQLEDVQIAYNSEVAQVAHHLDLTAGDTPTVFCYSGWNTPRNRDVPLSPSEEILLLMNRDNAPMRFVDCSTGFVFPDGGLNFQVVIPSPDVYEQIPPDIADWLALGTPILDFSEGAVVEMALQAELADALGVYTTTSPASLVTESDVSDRIPIPPPIRFGGNITWLGYESDPIEVYEAGEQVPVITYWRVEGVVPSDLLIFTHILSDPVTTAANRDTISIDPSRLEERDVFLQITLIPLLENMLAGDYDLSIGVYQDSSDTRLPVFVNEGQVRGDRIFLYPITILAANQ
ncbi:MAG: glycosyltransferase family 39 protein [Anaerolineae bacterium]|nr:glycosyltransferase family 39 protein [Anaerolineae bacterium]